MAGNSNSGRRPQPTSLKLLRGNPGKRRLDADREPVPEPVDATFDIPPAELDGNDRARAEWSRVAPLLRACGMVTKADRSSLLALCLEWSAYLGAQDELRASRLVIAASGKYKISPAVYAADRALSNCHWLWSELGLTPSGRAKVARLPAGRQATPDAPKSKWSGII